MSWDVSPLAPGDAAAAAAAAALLCGELGEGLYRPEWLLEDAAAPTAHVLMVRAPEREMVGTSVARVMTPADSGYYRAFGVEALELFAGTVGSFEAVAVAPGHRRLGIGRRLMAASLDWMRERGCTVAVSVSWQSGREGGSAGMFGRAGMEEGPTVERFYYEESLRDGWACPVCGMPCRCAATLFTRDLTR
jgi:GNAT superfamily N-acetyltransferase